MNENKKYDDFRIQIIIDSNCNLACEYCVLLNKNKKYDIDKAISYQVLDKYINFLNENYENLLKYYRKITITFFWWEPLLSKDKLLYFIEKLYNFDKINFVIHTNWILIDKNLIKLLRKYSNKKISFIISIDWGIELMLKYRLNNKFQFYKIIRWIKLLCENNINYFFSPSIMKPNSIDLFNNFKYLFKLKPKWIFINPVTAIYAYRELKSTKEIIKWIKLFLDYLINEIKLLDIDIINFLWLPLNINDYKNFLKFWINITWDINWEVHAMSFAWQWFDEWTTYTKEQLDIITLWNVIFNKKQLLNNLCRYDLYKDEKIIRVTYEQQKKWTLPDWDVQNMLGIFFIKYFKRFYKNNIKNNIKLKREII